MPIPRRKEEGKLKRLSTVHAAGDSLFASGRLTKEYRLHLYDLASNIKFLIDSGSVVSLVPKSAFKKMLQPDELELYAANGSVIRTYGSVHLSLNLKLRQAFA